MKKNILSVILTICSVLGWWGALYPQFTLLEGTYSVVCEEETMQAGDDMVECELDKEELYWEIMSADRSCIRMKSRLLEDLKALQGAGRVVHESGDQ